MQITALALTWLILINGMLSGFSSLPVHTQKAKSKSKQRKAERPRKPTVDNVVSNSILALPFKQSWQYLTDRATTLAPAVDEERIYFALTGGMVICLDLKSGALLWSSEPGGIISSPVAVDEKQVYVASRKLGEDGSDAGAAIRAIDKTTGLTLWVRDYARPFTSALTIVADRIYAGSADGSLYALKAASGEVIWKVPTQDIVRGLPLVADQIIYFGSDDGALRAIEQSTGKELWRLQTGGKIAGRPARDLENLYFGSGDGFAYSVKSDTGKLRWQSRTGAAIEASVTLERDRLFVASFDNFVYALSPENGDRVWKQRMSSRISAQPLVEGDSVLIAPLHSDQLICLLNTDGRTVSSFSLEDGFEITAEPLLIKGRLIVSTNKGLIVAVSTGLSVTESSPRP